MAPARCRWLSRPADRLLPPPPNWRLDAGQLHLERGDPQPTLPMLPPAPSHLPLSGGAFQQDRGEGVPANVTVSHRLDDSGERAGLPELDFARAGTRPGANHGGIVAVFFAVFDWSLFSTSLLLAAGTGITFEAASYEGIIKPKRPSTSLSRIASTSTLSPSSSPVARCARYHRRSPRQGSFTVSIRLVPLSSSRGRIVAVR